ncbi:MAG TPA: helix-turn-helix domain-containing protein [Candidatus Limnocylindrales bacterium]|nr:helix-turn-helix domain-containing protein [Candidatus Limnocylindrales bacterium]
MNETVKPRRPYRSTRRAEQAAQTRRDILASAGALFRERGYAGVSMPVIASEAGVVVETIYRAFGSKAGLFKAVIDAAVAGGSTRSDTPVEERPAIKAIIEEPDPRRQIAMYAATQPGIHRRSGPLLRALAAAAGSDADMRALWDEIEASRLAGQGRFVGMLGGRGALRTDISIEHATDVLWSLTSIAVFDMLVTRRGWSVERYEAWLAEALTCALLPAA